MSRKNFHDLLTKYTEGTCSSSEKEIVDQWYELLDDETLTEVNAEEMSAVESRLWEKIKLKTTVPVKNTVVRQMWVRWVVAASFIGLVLLGYFVYEGQFSQTRWIANELHTKFTEKKNTTASPLQVRLEDGSMVTLEPGSSVSFPSPFSAGKREVYLNGEAFFEVQKNLQRPFLVYNKEVITRVLGTSFSVKPVNEGSKVEISVRTGRVEVTENPHYSRTNKNKAGSGIILVPNQKGIYTSKDAKFETTLVDSPLPLTNESLVFDDQAMSKVIATFKRVYNIDILVENNNLNNCPVTGDFNRQGFYTQIDMICRAINASFERRSTKILIKGKGCN